MCSVCGCGVALGHGHGHGHGHGNGHGHGHGHGHGEENARVVRVERDILEKNQRFAQLNRVHLASTKTLALNLVSSPGSGKTTLLVRTLRELMHGPEALSLAVIEGDQQTRLDADRIAKTGTSVVQINTGKLCHLDASMIQDALGQLPKLDRGVLFVENVGNLVCPAGFDLGEAAKVVLVSVTEGEDKPLKYPDMFRAARVVVITKTDLLPHLDDFDVAILEANVRRICPQGLVVRVSAKTGQGMVDWRGIIASLRDEAMRP